MYMKLTYVITITQKMINVKIFIRMYRTQRLIVLKTDHYSFIHYRLITYNNYDIAILILLTKSDIMNYNKSIYCSNSNLNNITEIKTI